MHIEIYIVLVLLCQTGEKKEELLCFEVGETQKDRNKLIKEFKIALDDLINRQPHKLLAYRKHCIYLKDE